jgi:hypothetical protein
MARLLASSDNGIWVGRLEDMSSKERTRSDVPGIGNQLSCPICDAPVSAAPDRLFLAPPVEQAADPPASVECFLLLRVQAVIKRLKLRLDCL